MNHRAALELSLELAVARSGDPQPAIYARLFALHPAMEAEFWRDASGRIRGEMLARTLDMAVDLAERADADTGWSRAFLATEATTHDSYGIPRAIFGEFLGIVAAVIGEAGGDAFTPAMAAAWDAVLARADAVLAALPAIGDGQDLVIDPLRPAERAVPLSLG
jgi:hypothetical protein